MTTEQYLASAIVEGRAWSREDQAVLRDVQLARADARRERRALRRSSRRA